MWLEKKFKLKSSQTDIRRELIGGLTTFLTCSYIIFVQPTVLSQCGMDFGAVMVATCLASGLATILMGILANYPIALAPAMGHNFYFVFTVCLSLGISWQIGLGANFISGVLFIILSFWGFRQKLVNSIPGSLRFAIAVGIGLLIALVGLEWSGIVVDNPGTLVGLGDLTQGPVILSVVTFLIIILLMAKRVKGAIIIAIGASSLLSLIFGFSKFEGFLSLPPALSPTFLKLDFLSVFKNLDKLLTVIFILFFLDVFDTVGTLVGVGEQAHLFKDGKLPRAREALLADAVGTVGGTLLGTTTVTSYIESAAGVASGARTGLASIVTGFLFIISVFLFPLVKMVASGVAGSNLTLYPIIAPVLIVVGALMMVNVSKIPWSDLTESIPAFLTIVIMPFTFSITEGIAFGFISFCILKTVSGKIRQVHPLVFLFSLLFIARYIFIR